MIVVGVAGVFFGGYRDMAAAILRGELDALLTQPKTVLPRLLARESMAHAWGDLVTGTAILATLAGLDAARLPLTMLAVALGAAVYVSAAVDVREPRLLVRRRAQLRARPDGLPAAVLQPFRARSIRARPSSSPSPCFRPASWSSRR